MSQFRNYSVFDINHRIFRLSLNGEAIYSSSPWTTCQNDTREGDVWYTKKDDIIYGIVLGWPETDSVTLSCPIVDLIGTTITMLGSSEGSLAFDANSGPVQIQFPSMSQLQRDCNGKCNYGYVLKFENLLNIQ